MKTKIKKILSIFLVIFLFIPYISLAESFGISGGNLDSLGTLGSVGSLGSLLGISSVSEFVTQGSATVEDRYGFDKNMMRRAQQKEDVPTAEINFSNTSPEEGDFVSATAYSQRFKNVAEDLYYTWYIVHVDQKGDYVDSSGNKIIKDCDEEEDKEECKEWNESAVIEKGKVEAMGRIARGDFDPALFGVDYDAIVNQGVNNDGTVYIDDDDGFYTPFGGREGVGGRDGDRDEIGGIGSYETEDENMKDKKRGIVRGDRITRCYRHNFGNVSGGVEDVDSGKDLIVECKHKFADPDYLEDYSGYKEMGDTIKKYTISCVNPGKIGDNKFDEEDEACWRLNPNSADTDGDGFVDEADLAGVGQSTFSWRYKEGDRVGVIIEGTSMTAINDDGSIPDEESDYKDEIAETAGIQEEENTLYIGGGFIEKASLVVAIREIFNREFDSASWNSANDETNIEDLIEAIDSAGVTKTGGIINAEELEEALHDGKTISSLQREFSNNHMEVDDYMNDDYIEITGQFSAKDLFLTLAGYFRINQYELRDIIMDQSLGVQLEIAEKIIPRLYNMYDWTLMTEAEALQTLEDDVWYCNSCGGPYEITSFLFEYWSGTDKNDPEEYYELTQEDINGWYFNELVLGDAGYNPLITTPQYPYAVSIPVDSVYHFFEDGINMFSTSLVQTSSEVETTLEDGLHAAFISSSSGSSQDDLEDDLAEFDSKSASSAYYKIMWAGLGICSKENDEDDEGGLDGNECAKNPEDYYENKNYEDYDMDENPEDGSKYDPTEYGFNYLETRPVLLKEAETLKTALIYSPRNPLYDDLNPFLSDTITIYSQLEDATVDSNFVHYDWEIYKCSSLNDDTCTESDANWLTKKCAGSTGKVLGLSLEECTEKSTGTIENVTMFTSDSLASGMGVSSISFTPNGYYSNEYETGNLLTDDSEGKLFFKIALKTKELNSSDTMALSTTMIQVDKKDLKIEFYKTRKNSDGEFTYLDEKEAEMEICNDGFYSLLCPVYPFQLLAAKVAHDDDEKIHGYFWEIDGERIDAPQNCEGDGCNQDKEDALIYFPITRAFEDIQEITLNVQVEKTFNSGKESVIKNLTTTRYISVKNPMAFIKSEPPYSAWSRVERDPDYSGDYVNIFYTNPGKRVEFRADLVPSYLDLNNDEVSLIWSLNGKKVDEYFIENNPELDVFVNEDKISFIIPSVDFKGMTLGVNVIKQLSNNEDITTAWGVNIGKDKLEDFSSISIRPDLSALNITGDIGSVKMFFASTVKNAPEYILFSLKLSVIIMLIWGALFGSTIFLNTYKKD